MEFLLDIGAATLPHNKHWQFCVGSCHAPMAHRRDYLEQLKFIRDELGIERVRFHGLFNDDMNVGMSMRQFFPLPAAKRYKEISFYQIGKVFDNVLSTGMKPFVEVGFMPSILASGKRQCAFKYKGNVTMPKSISEWSEFIKSFIRFLIDRYGAEEIESWYFEIWNEPNLPVFFAGSKSDYFKLYKATAEAIKDVDSKIRVGGPSTAGNAWIDDFVDFCKSSGAPFDFVTTHQYSSEELGHAIKIGDIFKGLFKQLYILRKNKGNIIEGTRTVFRDESDFTEIKRGLFAKNAREIARMTDGKPLFYTEWNVSATCTAKINDSIRAASYVVKTVCEVEDYVDGTSFWSFSDIFEELMFFPYAFSGSFGMLTIDGIPKPSFYAFKLLSELGGERYITERNNAEVEMSAFRKDGDVQLLLYRQMFKQPDLPAEPVCVRLQCPKAPCSVKVKKIDASHGNPVAVWENIGAPQYLNKEQIEFIKQKSALEEEELPFEYADGTLTLNFGVGVNEVHLVTVCFEK